MNIGTWVLQGVLALVFLATGAMKIVKPKSALLTQPAMGWAEGFSDAQLKLIGLAEVLGAIGLVAPRAAGILPVLTPLAASCLVALMIGGAVVHVRRGEKPFPPMTLGAIAAVVAVCRFAFTT